LHPALMAGDHAWLPPHLFAAELSAEKPWQLHAQNPLRPQVVVFTA
jgi:hypothetical protein